MHDTLAINGPQRFMKRKKTIEQVRYIFIIRNGALGDFIVTLPVINSLKKAFPSAQIALMGNRYFLGLAQSHVDKVVPNDLFGFYTLFCPEGEFPENIKKMFRGVDFVVSYTPDPEGIFIKNLGKIGVPWVVDGGFSPVGKISAPIIDFLLSPLAREGIPIFVEHPKIVPSSGEKKIAREFFRASCHCEEENYPVVAIHPGSGSIKKCWPKENFAEVVKWTKKYLEATILLIKGPADKDIFESLWPLIKGCSPLVAEDLPLNHLAAIFEQCAVYVGNDSGVTHLAASVGTPTLALFGPTDARIWGPRNENVTCLSGSCPCAPCTIKRRSECHEQVCLSSLPVETVKKAMLGFLTGSCFSELTN
jgi:ADP-heptose:LPS heptosyltransferase